MRRTAGWVVAALMLVAAAPASADIHGSKTHFTGSCSITGTATFSNPLRATPGTNTYSFASSEESICTGVIGFGIATAASRTWRVAATASNTGQIACFGSALTDTTSSGRARIQFLNDDGTPATLDGTPTGQPLLLRLQMDTYAAANQVALVIRGGSAGRYPNGTNARGRAEFTAGADEVDACLGPGISALDFTAQIDTGPSRRSNGAIEALLLTR